MPFIDTPPWADKTQFFQSIVDAISLAFDQQPVCIWLMDETQKQLRIVAARGLSQDYIRDALLQLDRPSVASDVFRTGQTAIVPDIANDARWEYKEEATSRGLRSAIVSPLRIKKSIIGVLDVYWTQQRSEFTAFELRLVESFAHQVAVTQRHIRDTALLNRVSLLLNSDLRSATLFDLILQSVERVLGSDHASLYILDKSNKLNLQATSAQVKEHSVKQRSFAMGEGLAGWVAQERKSILVPDVRNDARFVAGLVADPGEPRSMVVAPLLSAEQQCLGVLSAGVAGEDSFDEDDLRLLETLANQTTIVIQNAKLLKREELLRRIDSRISQTLEVAETLKMILQGALELTDMKVGVIYLLNEPSTAITKSYEYPEGFGHPQPRLTDSNSMTCTIVATGQPFPVTDVSTNPNVNPVMLTQKGVYAVIGIPLTLDQKTVGILYLNDYQPRAFDTSDIELLTALANRAAIAVKNAQLYEVEQRRAKSLLVLHEVGQALTSGMRLRPEEIVTLLHQEASKLMDANNMFIALYDRDADTVKFPLLMKDGQRLEMAPRRQGRGRTEYIIRTKESIFLPTRQESEDWYKKPDREDYARASFGPWMGVPMIVGERVLGVIATYSPTRDHAYDEADFNILKSLANIAAIALDNTRLHYDVNERLRILHQLGNDLTSKLDLQPQEIVELAYQRASKLMDTSNMYIALYNGDSGIVSFPLYYENGARREVAPRQAGQGRTEYIIQTKEFIFLPARQESEDWYKQPGRDNYTGTAAPSWMGVPMMVGEKVIGVMATYHPDREYLYDRDDLTILSALANVTAIALRNAALYNETEHRLRMIKSVQEIDNATETYAELPRFLQSILELSLPKVQAQAGAIQLLDEAHNELVVYASVGPVVGQKYRRIPTSEGITGQAAREGRTIYVPNTRQNQDFLPYMEQMQSEIAIPLKAGDQVIGVFNIEDTRVDALSKEQRELLELIAAQASINIQHKWRLDQEQKKRLEVELDAETGRIARDIAHYVKNQIGMVRLDAIDLLEDKAIISASHKKLIERIRRNAELTIKLANDLFEPYRREGAPEWMEVSSLVSEAIGLVRLDSIGYEVHLPPTLPKVFVEKSGAVEVLHELFVNASKAMATREQSEKWIHVEGQLGSNDQVEVLVINNGPPIDASKWKVIFEQFQKAGGKDAYREGIGLGLWIAHTFMRRQGGDLSVHHSDERETAFLVRFPPIPQGPAKGE
jgi:GAF domain-containing protein